MLAGEAIAFHHGARGVRAALDAVEAADTDEERVRAEWVARFAMRRYEEFRRSDVSGAYELRAKWANRRGSLIRL
jgi:hypothetical protein